MNMKKIVTLGLMMMLLAGFLSPVVFADFADTDVRPMWYLDNDPDESPGWANRIMYQSPNGEPVNTENLSVEVLSGACIIWRANWPAEVNTPFYEEPWEGKMMLVEGNSADMDNIVLRLGYLYGTVFTDVGNTTLADDKVHKWGDFYEIYYNNDIGDYFTIPEGSYLALKVCNDSEDAINVRTGSSHAWLRAPSADPNYPLPEITTIALFATGLACVGGYILLRRRGFHNSSQ